MGYISVEIETARYQSRDGGKFAGMVEAATDAAAYNAARRGASMARGILGGAFGGHVHIDAEGGGGSWNITADGEFAEWAEFGTSPHPISPHDPTNVLVNKAEGFGPIFPRGSGVHHPGTQDYHMVESAGEAIAAEFEGILVSFLP